MDTPNPAADNEVAERLIQSFLDEWAAQGHDHAVEAEKTRERWTRSHKLTAAEADLLREWMWGRSNAVTSEAIDDHRLALGFYSTKEDADALERWMDKEGYR